MIYLVNGYYSDYDGSDCRHFYASVSKDKAEAKLAEIVARVELIKQAQKDYSEWMAISKPYEKFQVKEPHEVTQFWKEAKRNRNQDFNCPVMVKWRETQNEVNAKRNAYIAENTAIIGMKYGLLPEEIHSGKEQLEYFIEEIPSDDDD